MTRLFAILVQGIVIAGLLYFLVPPVRSKVDQLYQDWHERELAAMRLEQAIVERSVCVTPTP